MIGQNITFYVLEDDKSVEKYGVVLHEILAKSSTPEGHCCAITYFIVIDTFKKIHVVHPADFIKLISNI